MIFTPQLTMLPRPQRALWPELADTPTAFTLYGGTALALRLAHRVSVDFDFFSNSPFDPDTLVGKLSYLKGAERLQVAENTLTCRVQRGGPVLLSFFGGLSLGQIAPHDEACDTGLRVASLLDIAATKAAVVQKRAEVKDYVDIDALITHGVDLPAALAAGLIVYGRNFNPLITLKALAYFNDVPDLPDGIQGRLSIAVAAVDVTMLPVLTAVAPRPDEGLMP